MAHGVGWALSACPRAEPLPSPAAKALHKAPLRSSQPPFSKGASISQAASKAGMAPSGTFRTSRRGARNVSASEMTGLSGGRTLPLPHATTLFAMHVVRSLLAADTACSLSGRAPQCAGGALLNSHAAAQAWAEAHLGVGADVASLLRVLAPAEHASGAQESTSAAVRCTYEL
jgi:hypothetical protein